MPTVYHVDCECCGERCCGIPLDGTGLPGTLNFALSFVPGPLPPPPEAGCNGWNSVAGTLTRLTPDDPCYEEGVGTWVGYFEDDPDTGFFGGRVYFIFKVVNFGAGPCFVFGFWVPETCEYGGCLFNEEMGQAEILSCTPFHARSGKFIFADCLCIVGYNGTLYFDIFE